MVKDVTHNVKVQNVKNIQRNLTRFVPCHETDHITRGRTEGKYLSHGLHMEISSAET